MAAISTAASSAGSRTVKSTMPSSRVCHDIARFGCCAIRVPAAALNPEIIRANWEAVAANAS